MKIPAFIQLQDEAVREVQNATRTLTGCASFLDAHGIGKAFRLSSVILNLHKYQVGLAAERELPHIFDDHFLNQAIDLASHHVLRVMKHKARIPVKGGI